MKSQSIAVVTGAASGIGQAVASRLLSDGYLVGLCDRDSSLRAAFEEQLTAGNAVAVVGDITSEALRARLIDEVIAAFGGIDLLVNNAASGGAGKSLERLGLDDLRNTLEVNVVSVVALTTLALPYLKASQQARIVNLGSLFADDPTPDGSDYCASKGAIHSLTRAMAVEFGPHNITCNAVAPGFILTPMHEAEVEQQAKARSVDVETRYRELREQVPLGRHGAAEDVAATIAWLASPDSAYVSGAKIPINGGVNFT